VEYTGYAALIELITHLGLVPAILGGFMLLFFKMEKRSEQKRDEQTAAKDEQIAARDEFFKREMQDSNETFRRLMDTHLAEGVRREEQLRQEAEKRESILRQETEKREAMFMRTIDRFGDNMDKLSDSIGEMSKTLVQMDYRLGSIERNQFGHESGQNQGRHNR